MCPRHSRLVVGPVLVVEPALVAGRVLTATALVVWSQQGTPGKVKVLDSIRRYILRR